MSSLPGHLLRILVAPMIVATVGGCERPFVEREPPETVVLSPNLEVVQVEQPILLRVRTRAPTDGFSVLVNGVDMEEDDSGDGLFSLEVELHRGVNRLRIQTLASGEQLSSDTLQAVFLPGSSDVADFGLPDRRGGHSATRLESGNLLIVGGAPTPTSPAFTDALVFGGGDLSAIPRRIPTAGRRMEHTATLLPDGRVLIIGGSQVFEPTLVPQLVETVELYDPRVDGFTQIPVSGDPVRRSSHTTVLFTVAREGRLAVFLYLYGGFGDVRYGPTPRVGIRRDIRVFEFRNDSLVAAGPTFGPSIEAIADHTVTGIEPPFGSTAEFLFGGTYFASEASFESIAFESRFSANLGIFIEDLEPMKEPRSGQAASRLVPGEILIFGGRKSSFTAALNSIEVYHSRLKRFFRFPSDVTMIQERWGHTATNWDDSRILLLGGFGIAGEGLSTAEWFVVGTAEKTPTP